ncbi:MAG: hypothetical protein ACD_18C00054G0004 [uncultured bacterium]|nr:MAG: hypothetical protein ACD_18C00054G0004 [uncultured bacterium]OGH84704.1 MAG: hypothetical protein A2488_00625 [Candidatus Magasanikbacteria bacterium RIFOXYC12_FULL_32_21b]OGH88310.1 MAG: hypothetical protein A2507_01640 [Candidatus Magasanikbacteria bacterium RIFOXYD12_FULL_33_17]HAO52358.1 hypothetical protein [Candidatus Magasanikbacteria bacterium]
MIREGTRGGAPRHLHLVESPKGEIPEAKHEEQEPENTPYFFLTEKRREELKTVENCLQDPIILKNALDEIYKTHRTEIDQIEEINDAYKEAKLYDVEGLLILKEKWVDLQKKWEENYSDKTSHDETNYRLRNIKSTFIFINHNIDSLAKRAIHVVLKTTSSEAQRYHEHTRDKNEQEKKDSLQNNLETYKKWQKIRESLLAGDKTMWNDRYEEAWYFILGEIGLLASDFKNTDLGREAYQFVLEHFEDISENHTERLSIQKRVLNNIAMKDTSYFADSENLKEFKERVAKFAEMKEIGKLLSQAKTVYELVRMIQLHVPDTALEKGFTQPGKMTKEELIKTITDSISLGSIVTAEGDQIDLSKLSQADFAALKLGNQGQNRLSRNFGGFNMREFVLTKITDLEAWPIVLKLSVFALSKDTNAVFRYTTNDSENTIKTITAKELLDLVMNLPVTGEESLEVISELESATINIGNGNLIKSIAESCRKIIENNGTDKEET